MKAILAAVAALALSACEPYYTYEYVPVSEAVAAGDTAAVAAADDVGNATGADVPIPQKDPHGDLRLASFGVVDVGPQTSSSQRIRALHLRMTLTNLGERPWTLDTREQRIDLEGYGTSVAAFVSANAGSSPPIVSVLPKQKRVVDLFFPLPEKLQNDPNLPSFDVLWTVHADDTVESDRTPFESVLVQAPPYDATYDYGPDYYWGPPYWYNPFWVDFGWVGAVVIPPLYFGYPLYVHDHPYWGHFAPHRHYHGGYWHGGHYYPAHPYGPYHPHAGYPHRTYPHGPYPYGAYPRGAPYRTYPHGASPYRTYPHGAYPHGGAPRGYPHGAYPRGGAPYPGYPSGGHPHGGYPGGGHPHGGFPHGGSPHGGGHPGGGHGGGGGRR